MSRFKAIISDILAKSNTDRNLEPSELSLKKSERTSMTKAKTTLAYSAMNVPHATPTIPIPKYFARSTSRIALSEFRKIDKANNARLRPLPIKTPQITNNINAAGAESTRSTK